MRLPNSTIQQAAAISARELFRGGKLEFRSLKLDGVKIEW
jgi:hypothetical protein